MLPALLTTFFFAVTALVARRAITHVGPQRANLGRQLVGIVFLGFWAHIFGQGLQGGTFWLFFLSGVIGFGLGDWALFEAFLRIGPGLAVLLCQCLAAPIAAITERLWLGTQLTALQLGSSAVILCGVALALAPDPKEVMPSGHRLAGIGFGLFSATGQAWGAVLSRYTFQRAQHIGFSIDGITAAYQRLWGGIVTIVVLLLVGALHTRWRASPRDNVKSPDWRRGWPWILATAVFGPAIGVSCYQWALKTSPSSIVLPIVATTPLAVMLIAFAVQGIRPTGRAIFGSVIAVAGVVVLVRSS